MQTLFKEIFIFSMKNSLYTYVYSIFLFCFVDFAFFASIFAFLI